MVARFFPLEPDKAELLLDSAAGIHIANIQDAGEIPSGMLNALTDDHNKRFPAPRVTRRTTTATGVYNCHGLTFASRRTMVHEESVVRQVMAQDQYRRLTASELLPGDVILYVNNGKIEHSGVVVGVPEKSPIQSEKPSIVVVTKANVAANEIPVTGTFTWELRIKVVSKWGPALEMLHDLYDCPWAQEPDVDIQYWRMDLKNDPFNRTGSV